MAKDKEISDHELLAKLSAGDTAAFASLYQRYASRIYRLILKYVHSSAMADDLAQEVFIKLWDNREQLKNVLSFNAYVVTVARNHTLNSLKTALRHENTMGEIVRNYVALRQSGDEQLLDRDYAAFLTRELEKLPERTRLVFRLCRQEHRSYEEVAGKLGISKSAVKNHMVLSMKVLGTAVENELGVSLATLLAVVFLK